MLIIKAELIPTVRKTPKGGSRIPRIIRNRLFILVSLAFTETDFNFIVLNNLAGNLHPKDY